jgi:hypothetical protein
MRLIILIMVVRRVPPKNQQLNSSHMFFFPSSYLLFFLEKYAGHCKIKKTKKSEYLFVESNEVLIILIASI